MKFEVEGKGKSIGMTGVEKRNFHEPNRRILHIIKYLSLAERLKASKVRYFGLGRRFGGACARDISFEAILSLHLLYVKLRLISE